MHPPSPRSRRRRRATVVAVLAALTLVGAACGGDDQPSAGESSTTTGSVKLVTYDGYVLPEQAAKAFEQRTGRKIELVQLDDAGTALSQVMLTAGSPPGDVFFG